MVRLLALLAVATLPAAAHVIQITGVTIRLDPAGVTGRKYLVKMTRRLPTSQPEVTGSKKIPICS